MRITVNASRKYDVVIEESYNGLKDEVKRVVTGEKILIVTDDNVERLFLHKVIDELKGTYNIFTYVVKSGEDSKNSKNYFSILGSLLQNQFNRNDCVIALGGGVVGDLAGFVASTYMRGIAYIQLPTTLLSMIDSSIGGKTAINLDCTKNVVGTFYQPYLVYAATLALSTLPEREVVSGLGEAIKYAFLSCTVNRSCLIKDKLIKDKESAKTLIYECVNIKKKIVEEDEKESGKRALLNLGHTIGHAIEALSGFTVSHGQCVTMGIKKIIDMSCRYYELDDNKRQDMLSLVNINGTALSYNYTADEVINMIMHDKKSTNKGCNLVLVKDIGQPEIVNFDIDSLRRLYNAS